MNMRVLVTRDTNELGGEVQVWVGIRSHNLWITLSGMWKARSITDGNLPIPNKTLDAVFGDAIPAYGSIGWYNLTLSKAEDET